MLKKGFYTAVGTPMDSEGAILTDSYKRQIDDQIKAGASGILLYGTMGMGGCVKDSEYARGIEAAIEVIDSRVTLLVGASENSLARVRDKFDMMNTYDGIDGIVMTTPYYFGMSDANIVNFFEKTAVMTDKDYYLYDIMPVTNLKIKYEMVAELAKIKNVKGIKAGDAIMIKKLIDNPPKDDFTAIFSNSDLFSMGNLYGMEWYLDGIFSCMPKTIEKVQKGYNSGDFEAAKAALKNMMDARDIMLGAGIWPAFTYAMNELGYEGNFAPDYEVDIPDANKATVRKALQDICEL
ncbi:MAG: dihydrodipicolinate synthase family protein [Clostridia bacterium]|jgi:4-hydroxy-tetrahydrodipicolinate synthase|nr:dihydrodipicolinate synthase family protein [Clostridia bacterium]